MSLIMKTHFEQKQMFLSLPIDGGHNTSCSDHISAQTYLFMPDLTTGSLTRTFIGESVNPQRFLCRKDVFSRKRRLSGMSIMLPDRIAGSIHCHPDDERNIHQIKQNLEKHTLPDRLPARPVYVSLTRRTPVHASNTYSTISRNV